MCNTKQIWFTIKVEIKKYPCSKDNTDKEKGSQNSLHRTTSKIVRFYLETVQTEVAFYKRLFHAKLKLKSMFSSRVFPKHPLNLQIRTTQKKLFLSYIIHRHTSQFLSPWSIIYLSHKRPIIQSYKDESFLNCKTNREIYQYLEHGTRSHFNQYGMKVDTLLRA